MNVFDTATFFENKTFEKISLASEKVNEKEFENCIFNNCIFIECVFEKCRFIDCIFTDCSIGALKLTNSTITNIRFSDSKVMGVDWTKTKTVRLLSFERCDVRYSNFSFMKLPHMILKESVAHECNFADSDLSESNFSKTDFEKSVFSNTNLVKTDFRKAINYGIDVNFNKIRKAKFSLPEAASLLKSFEIELE